MPDAILDVADLMWVPILFIVVIAGIRWGNAWLDRPRKPPRIDASDDTQ